MGYHQVEEEFSDRAITAFLTHRKLYIYNVMPFGLCYALAIFQRFIKRVLRFLICVEELVYLDDFLINSNTFKQLIDVLSTVLKLLAEAGLKCKAIKYSLLSERVHDLGRIVSKNGNYPDTAKLEKLCNG